MAERVATAQMFIDVRLTITDPDPAYPFRCGANPLAGVLPFIRCPLPVLSRLGGCSWCAWGTRLPHIIRLVAQPEDFHGGASAAWGGGWRRRPPCPQHRVHKKSLEARRSMPKRPESGHGLSAGERQGGRLCEAHGNPWGLPLAEAQLPVARLHVIRRRFGGLEPMRGCLASLGMGTERGEAASRGRRHRFRHGPEAVGTASVRHLGPAARLLGPQRWRWVSDAAHDACLLLPACGGVSATHGCA